MSHEQTFYETLGVASTADMSAIRHAHRKLAQQSHPDKIHHLLMEFPWVEQEAALRYQRINEAFNVLSDDTARSRYDAELNQKWPDFVSRYAPPISDPVSHFTDPIAHSRPAPENPIIHTRPPEAVAAKPVAAEPVQTEHIHFNHFQQYSIPDLPFRQSDPRVPRRHTNPIAGFVAFIAVVAVIYASSHYQQLNQKTSDWLLQQGGGPNTSLHSTRVPGPDTPYQPLENNSSQSPAKSPVKNQPR
jgi:curved DNA-binding protein CbpA